MPTSIQDDTIGRLKDRKADRFLKSDNITFIDIDKTGYKDDWYCTTIPIKDECFYLLAFIFDQNCNIHFVDLGMNDITKPYRARLATGVNSLANGFILKPHSCYVDPNDVDIITHRGVKPLKSWLKDYASDSLYSLGAIRQRKSSMLFYVPELSSARSQYFLGIIKTHSYLNIEHVLENDNVIKEFLSNKRHYFRIKEIKGTDKEVINIRVNYITHSVLNIEELQGILVVDDNDDTRDISRFIHYILSNEFIILGAKMLKPDINTEYDTIGDIMIKAFSADDMRCLITRNLFLKGDK